MAQAPINGSTLRWARKTMGMGRAELAGAVGTSEERVSHFEAETALPTVVQLLKIAKKLDRTPAFFFLDPPENSGVPETADFRGYDGGPLPPLLLREMRRSEQHRETVIELDGAPPPPTVVEAIGPHNVSQRATQFRALLGLTEDFVPPGKNESQVLSFWRGLLERHGVLVFQTTKVPLSAFRGLSVFHEQLPIILINGSDSNNGKIFTLFHEVGHLSNRTSGLCGLDESVEDEALANAFAASFLMPQAQLRKVLETEGRTPQEMAQWISAAFKVSALAAGVRLRSLGIISDDALEEIWQESDQRWSKERERQRLRDGGPSPWRVRYRDLGPSYIGTVTRALEDQRIDWLDASYLLNARIPMVQHLVDEYRRTEAHA